MYATTTIISTTTKSSTQVCWDKDGNEIGVKVTVNDDTTLKTSDGYNVTGYTVSTNTTTDSDTGLGCILKCLKWSTRNDDGVGVSYSHPYTILNRVTANLTYDDDNDDDDKD